MSYVETTPGVQALDNATAKMGWRTEVQPDAQLRILPDYGGRTRNEIPYVAGPPELVVEISATSRYVELGPKLAEYDRAGVLEYVVLALAPDEVIWHARRDDRLTPIAPDADGLYRSAVFPGLWLDPAALLAGDPRRLRAVVEQGATTPEHAAFVAALAARRATT